MAKCLFCTSNKLSKEHIHPKWIFKHIGGFKNLKFIPNNRIVGISFDNTESPIYLGREDTSAIIPYENFTVKCVCSECNNGWMSIIENEAREIFKKIFYLDDPINEHILDESSSKILSKWAILRALVVSTVSPTPIFFDPAFLGTFKSGHIPDGFLVEAIRVDHMYLNYVVNAHAHHLPINCQLEDLYLDTEDLYIFGYHIGNIIFRVSYLGSPSVVRSQIDRELFALYPYRQNLEFATNLKSGRLYANKNPNAILEEICDCIVISDKYLGNK